MRTQLSAGLRTVGSRSFGVVMLAGVATAGCQRGDLPGLVSGRVLLDGRPLPAAAVVFCPASDGPASLGVTDADGRYELAFTSRKRGAVIGLHKVIVSTESDGPLEDPRLIPELAPLACTRRETTPLEKTVVAGRQTIDIELLSH
jgi:hypothetical protein